MPLRQDEQVDAVAEEDQEQDGPQASFSFLEDAAQHLDDRGHHEAVDQAQQPEVDWQLFIDCVLISYPGKALYTCYFFTFGYGQTDRQSL